MVIFRAPGLGSTSLAEVWIYKHPGIGTELASSQGGSHAETGTRTTALKSSPLKVLTKPPIITTQIPFLPFRALGLGQVGVGMEGACVFFIRKENLPWTQLWSLGKDLSTHGTAEVQTQSPWAPTTRDGDGWNTNLACSG